MKFILTIIVASAVAYGSMHFSTDSSAADEFIKQIKAEQRLASIN